VLTILGRKVSLSVLVSFLVSLVTAAGGAVTAILNQWGKVDPSALIILAVGVIGTAVTTIVHTWDTMPANMPATTVTPPPVAPAAVKAAPTPAPVPVWNGTSWELP
jgi:hypothetical protein